MKSDPDIWSSSTLPSWSEGVESFKSDLGPSITNNFNTVRVDRSLSAVEIPIAEKSLCGLSNIFGEAGAEAEGEVESRDGSESGSDEVGGSVKSLESKSSESSGYQSESSFEVDDDMEVRTVSVLHFRTTVSPCTYISTTITPCTEYERPVL